MAKATRTYVSNKTRTKAPGRGGFRKGAGRPPKFTDGEYITFRSPRTLRERIDEECAQTQKTRSEIITARLIGSYYGPQITQLPPEA